MQITPKHRRRCIRAHYLTQRGESIKQIAETLNISRATVRSDLQLVETHWSQLAAATADDILLESLQLLQLRLTIAIEHNPVHILRDRLTATEILRAEDARDTQLTALAREIRRTVQEVHRRADQRPNQPALEDDNPQISDETVTKLPISATPDQTISSPEQEIVDSDASEEKFPDPPDQDALIAEAIDHFPHLKGQSAEQILRFLEELTDPEAQNPEIPPQIYAEAAG